MNRWILHTYRTVGFLALLAGVAYCLQWTFVATSESLAGSDPLWRGLCLILLGLSGLIDVHGWELINDWHVGKPPVDVLVLVDGMGMLSWISAVFFAIGRVFVEPDVGLAQGGFAAFAALAVVYWIVLWLPWKATAGLWESIRAAWHYPGHPRKWPICLMTIILYSVSTLIAISLNVGWPRWIQLTEQRWRDTAIWLSVFVACYGGLGPIVKRHGYRLAWFGVFVVVALLAKYV